MYFPIIILITLLYSFRSAWGQIECDALISVTVNAQGEDVLKRASITCPFAANVMEVAVPGVSRVKLGTVYDYPDNVLTLHNQTHEELSAFNKHLIICESTDLATVLTAQCTPVIRYAECAVYERGVRCSYTGPTYLVRETCYLSSNRSCTETVLSYSQTGPHPLSLEMMAVENETMTAYACVVALSAVGTNQILPLSGQAMVCSERDITTLPPLSTFTTTPPESTTSAITTTLPPQCMCMCDCDSVGAVTAAYSTLVDTNSTTTTIAAETTATNVTGLEDYE